MATGVSGRLEYSASSEAIWCSLNGESLVRVEIRNNSQEAILFPPEQARELAKVLTELADKCVGYRITDGDD